MSGSSPLARGKRGLALCARGRYGSSPLARGKLHADTSAQHITRLIPARAGKTAAHMG